MITICDGRHTIFRNDISLWTRINFTRQAYISFENSLHLNLYAEIVFSTTLVIAWHLYLVRIVIIKWEINLKLFLILLHIYIQFKNFSYFHIIIIYISYILMYTTFSKTTTTMDEDDFFFLSLMYIYWKKSHTSRHSRYTEQSKYARTLFDQSSLIKVNTACAIMYVSKTIYEVARKLY